MERQSRRPIAQLFGHVITKPLGQRTRGLYLRRTVETVRSRLQYETPRAGWKAANSLELGRSRLRRLVGMILDEVIIIVKVD
jgi:hypothetical protein